MTKILTLFFCLFLFVSCAKDTPIDVTKVIERDKASQESIGSFPVSINDTVYESIVPGAPVSPGVRFGGLYNKRTVKEYIDALKIKPPPPPSPWDEFLRIMPIYARYGVLVGMLMLIVGAVMLAYKVPIADDVMIIGFIVAVFCTAFATLTVYFVYLSAALAICVIGYCGYILYSRERLKTFNKDLVLTTEIVKAKGWTEDAKILINSMHSDSLKKQVAKNKEQLKNFVNDLKKDSKNEI